jgi:hypothetical protein
MGIGYPVTYHVVWKNRNLVFQVIAHLHSSTVVSPIPGAYASSKKSEGLNYTIVET